MAGPPKGGSIEEATRRLDARRLFADVEAFRAEIGRVIEAMRADVSAAILSGLESGVSSVDSTLVEVVRATARRNEVLESGSDRDAERENEADEVGLELFVRAGFDPEHYAGRFRRELRSSGIANAFERCLASVAEPNTIARREGSHPTDCWRFYNTTVRQRDLQADHFAPILERSPRTVNLDRSGDGLRQAKDEVRQFFAAGENPMPGPMPGPAPTQAPTLDPGSTPE